MTYMLSPRTKTNRRPTEHEICSKIDFHWQVVSMTLQFVEQSIYLLRRGWDMKSRDTARTCSLLACAAERVFAIFQFSLLAARSIENQTALPPRPKTDEWMYCLCSFTCRHVTYHKEKVAIFVDLSLKLQSKYPKTKTICRTNIENFPLLYT